MSALTVGSLFSGIGGLELGLERAGMEVRWQVEIDDYCRRVLAKNWPNAARYEDVREVGEHNLEPVDLICGGFPCQDISYAGKGAGLDGERSGLWHEFARVVREVGPRYVLVENVPALLTRGLDAVLGTLASCGYDAEWDCIPAAAVGAPHIRDRVFIVAYPRGGAPQLLRESSQLAGATGTAEGEGRQRERRGDAVRDRGAIVAHPSRFTGPQEGAPIIAQRGRWDARHHDGGRDGRQVPRNHWWLSEPDVGRVADGVPARVDRLGALGNAVVPQVAEWIGRRIVEADAALRESEAA